jgi:hypothetical protein
MSEIRLRCNQWTARCTCPKYNMTWVKALRLPALDIGSDWTTRLCMVTVNSHLTICTWQRICRSFVKYRITTKTIESLALFNKKKFGTAALFKLWTSYRVMAPVFLNLPCCMEVREYHHPLEDLPREKSIYPGSE